MMHVEFARNFDGVDGILSADQFNDVIKKLDELINDDDVVEEYKDGFKVLKFKLLNLSLFDIEGEMVHIRLGLRELSLYSLALLTALPDWEEDAFSNRLRGSNLRIWHNNTKDEANE